MSDLSAQLDHLDALRRQLEAHFPLAPDVRRRLEYHYRLECNYHSNRIEGGTLTKPETRSVMIGNITVHGKPLKDIREMDGHDKLMLEILRVGHGELRLSEKRVQDMHRALIVEDDSERQREVGQWKQHGNHVINYRGEKFSFAPPDEVPEAINRLLDWLNVGLDRRGAKAPHPALLAFEFHLRFLTMHPFHDGNGRMARLLTNLVLVSLDYPPFWVSEGPEKAAYNRYLSDVQGYGGPPDQLYAFLTGLLARSLQLALDVVAGKETGEND